VIECRPSQVSGRNAQLREPNLSRWITRANL
jgi:hypothetical protein